MAGSTGVAVAAFLPWARSGRASRSGLQLARTLHRVDLGTAAGLRPVVVLFLFVPALAAAVWVAAARDRPLAAGTLAALTGLVAVLAWVALALSPLPARAGAHVGLASGAVAVAAGAVTVVEAAARTRRRRHR